MLNIPLFPIVTLLLVSLLTGCKVSPSATTETYVLSEEVRRDIRNKRWNTDTLRDPLESAVFHSNINDVKLLVNKGHDLHFDQGKYQKTLLHIASKYSSYEMNKYLLEQGVDVAGRKDNGWTPLHNACRYRDAKLVELYLKHGANPNDGSGYLCSVTTGWYDAVAKVETFKKYKLDFARENVCIHDLLAVNAGDLLSLYVKYGVDPLKVDEYGWNYLHWAAYYGSDNCVRYLYQFQELRSGTRSELQREIRLDGEMRDVTYTKSSLPIDIARINGHDEVVKVLQDLIYK